MNEVTVMALKYLDGKITLDMMDKRVRKAIVKRASQIITERCWKGKGATL